MSKTVRSTQIYTSSKHWSMQTYNHSPLTPAHIAIPLLLSQAPIIESQVGINSRSCTWLGQKQLLQGGNVFFTQHFTLIRQCAATRDTLDSRWLSFALNKGFAASRGEGLYEAKQNRLSIVHTQTQARTLAFLHMSTPHTCRNRFCLDFTQ